MAEGEDAARVRWCASAPVFARTIAKDLQRRCQRILEEHGLAKMHMAFIFTLSSGGATLGDLSGRLDVDKAHVTRAVAFLAERGLARDDRESEKSRNYKVFLTAKGEAVATDLKRVMSDAFADYMRGVSDEEIRVLMSVQGRIRSNIDPDGKLGDEHRGCGF
ncbi:MAG: hypothetical protein LBS92_00365 [Candidatus Methanoplasma sp.]|jgi:DNA-binding MarR family transcriptional regulator|nr:hypothetical protein [Candidatus Methanoplasma sp.]